MTTIVKKNSNKEVLERIRNSRLTASEKAEAVNALALADLVVDGILAVTAGVERLTRSTLQPSH